MLAATYSTSGTFPVGGFLFLLLPLLVLGVIALAGLWKMYAKAGVPGWGAIVPFYNTYLYLQIGGFNGWLFLVSLIPFVGGLFLFVLTLMAALNIAKDFGKGTGFGLGLAFLPFIFAVILGFGEAEYQGAQAAADQTYAPRPVPSLVGERPAEGPFAVAPTSPTPPPPSANLPPAGWFADPQNPAHLRYWDGAAWTEHTTPKPPSA